MWPPPPSQLARQHQQRKGKGSKLKTFFRPPPTHAKVTFWFLTSLMGLIILICDLHYYIATGMPIPAPTSSLKGRWLKTKCEPLLSDPHPTPAKEIFCFWEVDWIDLIYVWVPPPLYPLAHQPQNQLICLTGKLLQGIKLQCLYARKLHCAVCGVVLSDHLQWGLPILYRVYPLRYLCVVHNAIHSYVCLYATHTRSMKCILCTLQCWAAAVRSSIQHSVCHAVGLLCSV